MVVIIKERVQEYLHAIGRDQSWLAKKFGVTKGYISVVVNNKCKMPLVMIERLMILTGMRFENLFYFDGHLDKREFYGSAIFNGGEMLDNFAYKKTLDRIRVKVYKVSMRSLHKIYSKNSDGNSVNNYAIRQIKFTQSLNIRDWDFLF